MSVWLVVKIPQKMNVRNLSESAAITVIILGHMIIVVGAKKNGGMMNKTKIDWPWDNLYSWNPAIGCERHCFNDQCWAYKTNERLKNIEKITSRKISGWVKDFWKVNYLDIYLDKMPRRKPAHILVGIRSDISYWREWFLEDVLNRCFCMPHTFVFCTKDPYIYTEVPLFQDTHANLLLGTTITCKDYDYNKLSWNKEIKARQFLSVEPLLGHFSFGIDTDLFETVIVGAMSGKDAVKPKPEWIRSIRDNVPEDKIFWKKNIQKYI